PRAGLGTVQDSATRGGGGVLVRGVAGARLRAERLEAALRLPRVESGREDRVLAAGAEALWLRGVGWRRAAERLGPLAHPRVCVGRDGIADAVPRVGAGADG